MASGVRFTKPERELLDRLLDRAASQVGALEVSAKDVKIIAGIQAKLFASELKKKSTPGLGWQTAHRVMREVLGDRVTVPPAPMEQWCIWMNKRIRDLGLTEEHCRTIATNVKGWNGNISFESLIKGADRYLAAPASTRNATPHPPKKYGGHGIGSMTAPVLAED